EQLLQVGLLLEVGLLSLDGALVDGAGGAVNGDQLALAHNLVRAADLEEPLVVVDADRLAADDGRKPQAARDDRCVAAGAAATGEDTLGDEHAVDVVGAGLLAHQDDLLAGLAGGLGAVGVKDDLADGGSGAGVHALGEDAAFLLGAGDI